MATQAAWRHLGLQAPGVAPGLFEGGSGAA
jgi:hypothetical protein